MTSEETEICTLLRRFPNQFVAVHDISKSVGSRKNYNKDRNWVLPILRRMELEGWLEANPLGEFRLKHLADETTTFKAALETPGVPLGDTTIIIQGQPNGGAAAGA